MGIVVEKKLRYTGSSDVFVDTDGTEFVKDGEAHYVSAAHAKVLKALPQDDFDVVAIATEGDEPANPAVKKAD